MNKGCPHFGGNLIDGRKSSVIMVLIRVKIKKEKSELALFKARLLCKFISSLAKGRLIMVTRQVFSFQKKKKEKGKSAPIIHLCVFAI